MNLVPSNCRFQQNLLSSLPPNDIRFEFILSTSSTFLIEKRVEYNQLSQYPKGMDIKVTKFTDIYKYFSEYEQRDTNLTIHHGVTVEMMRNLLLDAALQQLRFLYLICCYIFITLYVCNSK